MTVWEARIDLQNDDTRLIDEGTMIGGGGREIIETVFVLRADLEYGDIHAINKAPVEIRPVAEIERKVVAPACIVLAAIIAVGAFPIVRPWWERRSSSLVAISMEQVSRSC